MSRSRVPGSAPARSAGRQPPPARGTHAPTVAPSPEAVVGGELCGCHQAGCETCASNGGKDILDQDLHSASVDRYRSFLDISDTTALDEWQKALVMYTNLANLVA